ncbi:MAG TPA: DUF4388 domain-containing protein [Oculatellaceae cyanobacterium]
MSVDLMVAEQTQTTEINLDQLNKFVSQDNVVVLKWSPELTLELDALIERRRLFDAVLVDCTECGYLFPCELLVDGCRNINHFLQLNGALIFLQEDKAVAVVRQTLMGSLSFHIFNSYAELFDYSPPLAKQAVNVLSLDTDKKDESTDLSRQVLMSSVPVLTNHGIKLKGSISEAARRNCVLAAVDNYTPLGTISQRLTSQGRLTDDQLLDQLRELEKEKAIFPLFSKIPFLVNCFRQQTPFSLKEYLSSAKLVTDDQLDSMIFELQNMPVKDRLTLGPFAVKKGFVSARQLEIAMQDQAFYGQSGESDQVKHVKNTSEETQVQSLVGHLGTTDPSNLLQNLATNRETGVLSVEYRDLHFRAQFDLGKLTHAKVGKVEGNRAVAEFASAWKDGIFVFIHRTPPADLTKESSKVTKPLDKLLLDAALAKDNTDVVLNKLPKGIHSVLEKIADEDGLLNCGELVDPVEEDIPLTDAEIGVMKRTHAMLDGLTTLSTAIRYLGDVTTAELARAVGLLLHYQLADVPAVDISVPLTKFKLLTKCVAEKINAERSTAYLRLSLRDGIGYSQRARVFALTPNGDVGIDMAAAKQAQTSLTNVISDLENWQIKYIEYVSQDIARDDLLELIQRIHGDTDGAGGDSEDGQEE